MALTEEEKNELVQDVVNQIKTDSQSVDELETVSTLDGVVSLPAMRGETVVSAPVKLLSKPAEDAAATAKASAAVADAATKSAGEARPKRRRRPRPPPMRQARLRTLRRKQMQPWQRLCKWRRSTRLRHLRQGTVRQLGSTDLWKVWK